MNNRLRRGATGFAGELAHTHVHPDGPLCHCGGRGCLATVLGEDMFRALEPDSDRPDRTRAIDAIAATLGRSLSPLCALLNPQAIILDAGLGEHSSRVRDGITDSLRATTSPVAVENLHILPGQLADPELLSGPALARSAGRRPRVPRRVRAVTQRRLLPPRIPDPMAAPGVRWGILAPGWIAGQFASALRRGTRQEIVAVGSRNLHRARAFADEHGAPAAYGSYDELVHDPQVDIVYVASPHSEHHRQARLALEAGKPVVVEKAFTRNAAEARDLVDLAQARRLFLLEGMWSRFLPHYDVVHQALHGGLIGEVTTVFADHGQHLYPNGPDRLANPDLAGGALLDLGVYPVSFADFVLGPFTAITATGTLTDRGVDQQEAITVSNATGALGVLHTSMLAASPCTATICGTDGRLDIAGTFYLPTSVTLYNRDGVAVDRYDPTGDVAHQGLRYEAAEVARSIDAGATESSLHPLATTVRTMQAMDEIRRQLGVHFPRE